MTGSVRGAMMVSRAANHEGLSLSFSPSADFRLHFGQVQSRPASGKIISRLRVFLMPEANIFMLPLIAALHKASCILPEAVHQGSMYVS